jgi:hypothetical protein
MGLYFLYLFSSPFLSQAIPVAWFCLFYKLLSHYNKFLYIYKIWLFLYFSLGDGKNCLLIEEKKNERRVRWRGYKKGCCVCLEYPAAPQAKATKGLLWYLLASLLVAFNFISSWLFCHHGFIKQTLAKYV